jgi:hypothetical protein
VVFEVVIVTVDDTAIIKAALIEKSNRNLTQMGRVQQIREKPPGFARCSADEHPALTDGGRFPIANESAG